MRIKGALRLDLYGANQGGELKLKPQPTSQ